MFKNGVLTINYDTWRGGIAPSPFSGLGDLRNADIYTKPGALLCGRKAVKESGSTVTDFVRYMRYDEVNNILYAGDDSGKLYQRTSGGTWGEVENASVPVSEADECNGMELWKGHLFYAEDTVLECFDIDAPFWNASWQTFAEGQRNSIDVPHPMLVAQDDVLYIADGKYIASLTETAGDTFDPNDGASYTWNSQALDLPDGYVASSLTEYGDGLIIGTYYDSVLNRGNRANTFVWIPTSEIGTFSFNDTKFLKGNGIWQQVVQGNLVYQVADRSAGKLYATNLSVYELQHELRNIEYGSSILSYNPDAIDIVDDQILFGVGSTSTNVENLGVYGYKDGALTLQTVSAGDTDVQIGSVTPLSDNDYAISWEYDSTHGVDVVSTTRTDSYGTVMETGVAQVGTPLNPKQFQNLDIVFGKVLATDQGVRLSYRTSVGESWTTMGTYDFATYGAVSSINAGASISDLTTIQIKVELTAAASSTDTPELISIEIY